MSAAENATETAPETPLSDAPTARVQQATATMQGPRRHRAPWEPPSWYGRATLFVLAPFLDPHDNYPSGPRCLVWTIVIGAICKHEISPSLAWVCIPTMWGYSMVKDASARTTLSLSAAATTTLNYGRTIAKTVTENITRVLNGRDVTNGFDPSKPEPDPSGGAE